MKKLFAIVALTLALGGFVFPVAVVHANEETVAAAGRATVINESTEREVAAAEREGVRSTVGAGANTAIELSAKALFGILIPVAEFLIRVVSWILWILSVVFNIVVRELVVEMGKYVTSQSAEGIRVAWTVMRDLANIGIIGGLIAVAVGTILHVQSLDAKKYLVRLIIAALLVNFSYFFAGAIIDASNFLATAIYKSVITTDACANGSVGDSALSTLYGWGTPPQGQNDHCTIADRFLELINIQGLRVANNPLQNIPLIGGAVGFAVDLVLSDAGSLFKLFIYDIMLIILELVTIFIFLSAIALLLGRFVSLILILITSPLGVAGVAIPKLSGYAKKWWEALFSQALFAPVYFLLVGIALIVIKNSKDAIIGATRGAGTDFADLIGIVLTFAVASIFMLQSLRIAKQLSEQTKELADVYKASKFATGWAGSGLKYVGSSIATSTVGKTADRLGRGYEKWMAKEGRVQKFLAGTGLDRGIQKGFNTVADAKFGSKEGYLTRIEKAEERQARLGDVRTSQANLNKLKAPGGLIDQHNDAQKRKDAIDAEDKKHRVLADTIAKEKFKKNFDDLSKEQKAEVMADQRWKDSKMAKDLDTLTSEDEKYKGRSWADLNDRERRDLLARGREDGRWQGRLWTVKKGKGGWEDDWEYRDGLRRSVNLNTKEEQKAGKEKLTYQSALDAATSAAGEISYATLKEEFRRDPNLLPKIAMSLSEDQWIQMKKDESISRTTKNKVRDIRMGDIMREARDFETNVRELDEWQKLSPDQRKGLVLRGSNEYHQFRIRLHQTFKKYHKEAEVIDYIESDEGIKNGMRKNKVLIDAVKKSVGEGLQNSDKISFGEKRKMREYKRSRAIDSDKMDSEAVEMFEELGMTREADRDESMRTLIDPVTKEAILDPTTGEKISVTDSMTGGAISYEDFEEKWEKLKTPDGQSTKESDLLYAAWLRKRSDEQTKNYFHGKSAGEIDYELKQEAYGKRLIGKYMSPEQLMASNKDQSWKNDQAKAMAIYGSDETIHWLRNTPTGKSFAVDWEEVNEERAALGLPTIDDTPETLQEVTPDEGDEG